MFVTASSTADRTAAAVGGSSNAAAVETTAATGGPDSASTTNQPRPTAPSATGSPARSTYPPTLSCHRNTRSVGSPSAPRSTPTSPSTPPSVSSDSNRSANRSRTRNAVPAPTGNSTATPSSTTSYPSAANTGSNGRDVRCPLAQTVNRHTATADPAGYQATIGSTRPRTTAATATRTNTTATTACGTNCTATTTARPAITEPAAPRGRPDANHPNANTKTP